MTDSKTTAPERQDGQPGQNAGIEMDDLQAAINQEASPLFDFLVKNAKPIIIGVAAIVIVAAGYGGIQAWSSYSQSQAAKEMAQILSLGGEEKIAALKDYAPTAPDSVKGGALFELAGTLMASGDYAAAAGVWEQIEALGNPEMKTLAQMGRARCLLLAEESAQAFELSKSLMASAPESLKAPGNRLLAACAEAAGDKGAAAAALQELLDSGSAVDAPLLSYRIKTLTAE